MKTFFTKLFIFIFVVLLGTFLFYKWFETKNVVEEGEVSIYEGASIKQIADILETNGTIESSTIFFGYIRGKQIVNRLNPFSSRPFEVEFKAGDFDIEEGDFNSLIDTLNEARNIDPNNYVKVTIPEGSTIEEIAQLLDDERVIEKDNFLKQVNTEKLYERLKKEYLWLPSYNEERKYQLEGYLHANTYEFKEDSDTSTIVERMIKPTDEWQKSEKVEIVDSDYDFSELITLASIIERESKFEEDRPKVSRVFQNRMREGKKLQSDITALYALGEHKKFVTYEDIEVDSPYNTYNVEGLPIGPIGSPSYQSFKAALHPEKNFEYKYFYARPNGETFYSKTLEDHQKVIDKYEGEWLEILE